MFTSSEHATLKMTCTRNQGSSMKSMTAINSNNWVIYVLRYNVEVFVYYVYIYVILAVARGK